MKERLALDWIRQCPFPARLIAFLGALVVCWAPWAMLSISLPWLPKELAWISLYGLLLGGLWQWAAQIRTSTQPFYDYGLTRRYPFYQEVLIGWSWGWSGLALLFTVEGLLGWLVWRAFDPIQVWIYLLAGIGLGLLVALVEELLFRGWLVEELAVDYGPYWSGPISSVVFALAHFIKPVSEILKTWPQFPGLLLGGWILVYARQLSRGRLGLSLGLHSGWVSGIAVVNNLQWIHYTGRVPEWVTGISDNPLAGVSGLILLGSVAGLLHISGKKWQAFNQGSI